MRAPSRTTVHAASIVWLDGARRGEIRTRSGRPFKPSTIRAYETALRLRVLPALGGVRVSELRRTDLQDFVDRMVAAGDNPSTLQGTLLPLRAIYRRAVSRGEVANNPTSGLELPAIERNRPDIVSPERAAALLDALPADDRALWATALYGGLRRGELMALRFEDVDIDAGLIHVERGWDDRDGAILPKSREGRRVVPIASALRGPLLEHRLRLGRRHGLVFGATAARPFSQTAVRDRADAAWGAAGLERITLHQARHTFASLAIAAGVNAKALSTYMGHSSIQVTFDKYGHLMPGNEQEAADLLDTFLGRVLDVAT